MIAKTYHSTLEKEKRKISNFQQAKDSQHAIGQNFNRTLRLIAEVYDQIKDTVGALPAEHGGMLGGELSSGTISHFAFDNSANRSSATYSPDHEAINKVLKQDWNPADIRLLGFVHSHPAGSRRPSHGDEIYAERILDYNQDQEFLWLPIVISEADTGKFELLPFVAERSQDGVSIMSANLEIVDQVEVEEPLLPITFQRVKGAYDLQHLAHCRVIIVGIGGATAFVEELARAGVGEFVLIDKDTVSETNLATQQVYRKDIGRPKVECLAERILDINPDALVFSYQLF